MENKVRIMKKSLTGIFSVVLMLAGFQSIMAQYTNSYTGATWNNSYSNMMDMTRTWNQSLWDQQSRLQQITNQTRQIANASNSNTGNSNASASNTTTTTTTAAAPPAEKQFLITETDFIPASQLPVVPGQIANGMPNISMDDREKLYTAYCQTLTIFGTTFRKNNLANSFAYIIAMSLEITKGKPLSGNEVIQLINYYNNALAKVPQFLNLSPMKKQVLYESQIITAASMGALYTQGKQQNNAEMQAQATTMAKNIVKNYLGIDTP